jgi:hypothetical protein
MKFFLIFSTLFALHISVTTYTMQHKRFKTTQESADTLTKIPNLMSLCTQKIYKHLIGNHTHLSDGVSQVISFFEDQCRDVPSLLICAIMQLILKEPNHILRGTFLPVFIEYCLRKMLAETQSQIEDTMTYLHEQLTKEHKTPWASTAFALIHAILTDTAFADRGTTQPLTRACHLHCTLLQEYLIRYRLSLPNIFYSLKQLITTKQLHGVAVLTDILLKNKRLFDAYRDEKEYEATECYVEALRYNYSNLIPKIFEFNNGYLHIFRYRSDSNTYLVHPSFTKDLLDGNPTVLKGLITLAQQKNIDINTIRVRILKTHCDASSVGEGYMDIPLISFTVADSKLLQTPYIFKYCSDTGTYLVNSSFNKDLLDGAMDTVKKIVSLAKQQAIDINAIRVRIIDTHDNAFSNAIISFRLRC